MSELFQIWAPSIRVWAQWAKPVLFACESAIDPGNLLVPPAWPKLDAPNDHMTALVIDLPREMAAEYGIAAARDGYWPVPLFNCAYGPGAVLNVLTLIERLIAGARELGQLNVPADAPPAFLTDSKRMSPDAPLQPGKFDNRYILLPQDFPSASFLKAHGIMRVVWIRSEIEQSNLMLRSKVTEDLAHIFRRWQEAGLEIYSSELSTQQTERIEVQEPSRFRSLFYRAIALAGLRRNSSGGFGGIIPQPSSGG